MSWVLSAFADEAGPSINEQIAALGRGGIRHIDLRSVDGVNICELPAEQARQIKARLDAAGIAVNMFGSPIGKLDIADDFAVDMKRLRHLGQLRDIFGCKAVRMFSYFNKSNAPLEKWRQVALERVAQLKDEAGKLGLVLYHENERHIFGDAPDNTLTLLQELRDGKTFLGIFDFSNFNMSGFDVWAAWEMLKPYTDCFHLKDSDAAKMHVPLGQGAGRVRDILAAALASRWQGPLVLEPHLFHSQAVLATGPSGQINAQYSKLPKNDSFHIAATAATELLRSLKAPVV